MGESEHHWGQHHGPPVGARIQAFGAAAAAVPGQGGGESPPAGLQFLVAGRAHVNHGMDVREWDRAKGKSAWADKVLQMLLTGNGESSEKVMLDAPRQVVVTKEG